MHLKYRNINDAFKGVVEGMHTGLLPVIRERSRQGDVLRVTEPVMMTFTHPRERVLFNSSRNGNCFLHLYHSLWQLAGRNDVAPLAYYASKMMEFSDDGKTLNGAYGYKWRNGKTPTDENFDGGVSCELPAGSQWIGHVDQLSLLVAHLKSNPNSRRAVLSMWNVEDDLLKIGGEKVKTKGCDKNFCLGTDHRWPKCPNCGSVRDDALKSRVVISGSKDVCCNLDVMFNLRQEPHRVDDEPLILDMTVTNRSNDLVLGLLGTDYVDFSFLQEYMAARIGAEVGVYHHFTNNLHAYEWNWKPDEWLATDSAIDRGAYSENLIPLIKDPAAFEKELPLFVETFSGDNTNRKTWPQYDEPFLADVAYPMMAAFYLHKTKQFERALAECDNIAADDWRIAATNWIKRRVKK